MRGSFTLSKAIKAAESSKRTFREYKAFPKNYKREKIHKILEGFGVEIQRSILVSWLPEGGRSLGIQLIDQHGYVCFFDIDPDLPSYNEYRRDGHISEYERNNRFRQRRPWDDLVLAIKMYREENSDLS